MNETNTSESTAELVERYLQATFLVAVSLLALIGNVSLWIVIVTNRRLREPANALILCLSAADLLVSAVNMPVIVHTIVVGRWTMSAGACTVLGFITMLTFVNSVMSLGVISVNRYVHICHSTRYMTLYSTTNTACFILGTWLVSAALAIPPLVGWGKYDYLDNQFFCFCDWKTSISYTLFMVGICFGGPCSVMTFCYVNILRMVRESKRKIADASALKTSTATATGAGPLSGKNESLGRNPNNDSIYGKCSSLFACVSRQPKQPVSESGAIGDTPSVQAKARVSSMRTDDVSTIYSQSAQPRDPYPKDDSDGCGYSTVAVGTNYEKHRPTENVYVGQSSDLSTDRSDVQHCQDRPVQAQESAASRRQVSFVITAPETRLAAHADSEPLQRKQFGRSLAVPNISDGPRVLSMALHKKRQAQRRSQDELRLTKSFLVVIFLFIICWLPFCISMFYYVFSPTPAPRRLDMMTLLLGCLNSACNPLVYGLMNRKFKEGFTKLYCPRYYQAMMQKSRINGAPMKSGLN